jgi:hypothetical protein
MTQQQLIINLLEIIILIFFLKSNEIKNYFYPAKYFSEDEIKNLPIELPLDDKLINLLKLNNVNKINYTKIFSYIKKYYPNNLDIKFNFLFDFFEIEFLFVIFLWPIISIYVLYKYVKLKKNNNFKQQHVNFYELYKEKNLLNIKIYFTITLLFSMYFNKTYYLISFCSFLLYTIITLIIVILYKHYVFIQQLNKINFVTRDGITYIYKDQTNEFLDIINNI